jgi:ATP-dependent exoDNAse (exonuclease V) alpha subunit
MDVIFKDVRPDVRVGGRYIDILKGDKVMYFNNKKKREYVNGEFGERKNMTEDEVEYVVLEHLKDEEDLRETRELQEAYRKEIEAGRTYW